MKGGIRINVYDMLEQRRLRNREKKKRRKARKAEVAETAAASKATATAQSDAGYVADADDPEASNLHEILGSWSSQKADTEKKSNKDIPWKVHVSTDDRDSQRIDSFMSTLFPDFSDFRSDTVPMSPMSTSPSTPSTSSSHFESGHPSHFVTSSEGLKANPWPFTDAEAEESSDDEDMSDIVAVKPEVRRFEIPYHTQVPLQGLQAPSAKLKTTKSSKIEKFPGRISGDASILRRETRCLEDP